jgi:hypothetical protein
MRFVFDEPPYGTPIPGAGAVHHIKTAKQANEIGEPAGGK